jgi:hypothetical protein
LMHLFSSINAAFALRPQHAAAGAVEEEEAEEEAEEEEAEELHARNRCSPPSSSQGPPGVHQKHDKK